MDLGHSLVSQTSPLYQKYCWYVESVVFSTTEIISNGRDRASDPQNWTAFFSFTIILHSLPLTTDEAYGIDCMCVCLLSMCLKHLWGRVGSTDGFFARKPALKRLDSSVRRERPTGRSSYSRLLSFEPRLSCERTVCRPDPTSEYVCFCAAVVIVNWRADLRKNFESTTRSSAIADGPRDASCQLKSCQLPNNSAENTWTTSPEQIEVMKLEG